ncbi:MAG: DNA ligase D [Armatimonadota bacterium]
MMPLDEYQKKRDFEQTPEPKGVESKDEGRRFVVHEHHASRLHFDLRLEMDGVLKSWAIPKGPSMNPADKRLAVMVEDHPMEYLNFRGEIAEGNYGAGEVEIWDSGTYELIEDELENGKLLMNMVGVKLHGEFHFVRLKKGKDEWLLMKGKDSFADPTWTLEQILPGGSRRQREELKSKEPDTANESSAVVESDPMPQIISPMLATLVEKPFSSPDWLFEIKWDGYRAISFIEKDSFRFVSRRNMDIAGKFPQSESIPGLIDAELAIIDGEIVVVDENGKPDFQSLQNIANIYPSHKVVDKSVIRLVYYVFDLLYLNGKDLRDLPLIERKKLLKSIVRPNDFMKYSDEIIERGNELYEQAIQMGLEGIIAKKLDSPYLEKRTSYWQKIKTEHRQEVVIAGYTQPRNSRAYFGALAIGVYDGDKLKFAGHVGGGFDDNTLKQVFDLLQPLKTDESPFESIPATNEPVQWVQPQLICEVKFAEWTDDGVMRQPVFLGMRQDKLPEEVLREQPVNPSELAGSPASVQDDPPPKVKHKSEPVEEVFSRKELRGNVIVKVDGAEVSLTNMDKVYWPDEGISKGELLRYYYRVSKTILPYIKGRPQILKRFPNGIKEEPFFQHNVGNPPEFLRTEPVREGADIINYAIVDNTASLLYLANLGNISINTFMSRTDSLKNPDWIALDLDPEETSFETVCEVGMVAEGVLKEIGLSGYPKTSGSRGMHIFIPIENNYTFEQTQAFGRIISTVISARIPEKATTNRTIKKRTNEQVYVDFLQNADGKSITSPYSVRERPGATVSTPLTWDEVASKPDKNTYTIFNTLDRIQAQGDLFQDVLKNRQNLTEPVKLLAKLLEK